MSVYHNVVQNSDEWLQLRKGKFTASSFNNLFASKTTATYKNTIYKAVFERLTGESPESFKSAYMERGHELEPHARIAYGEETLNKVKNGGFFTLDDWTGASPDGLIEEDGLLEIKSPAYNTMIEYLLDGKLPRIYKWQVHGQLLVANKQWCDFMAYHPHLEHVIVRVKRDEEIEQELKTKLQEAVNKATNIMERLRPAA